tara:strand:- start:5244 stop:5993 length:750 start_codon:yes stop_codon:yes gene_type:complete
MEIHLITLLPEFFNCLQHGLTAKAINGPMQLNVHPLRNFSQRNDRRIDDRPYGGGPGMVMEAEPIMLAREAILAQSPKTQFIITDPKGKPFKQTDAVYLSKLPSVSIICGRYEGIDQRAYQKDDLVYSLGDFVLTGGEIAATAIIDAISRLLPGTLGNQSSYEHDSFQTGLLDHPCYTRPEVWRGKKVPPVLLSGNHKDIENWQRYQQLGLTWQRRPDLIENVDLSDNDRKLLSKFIEDNPDVSPDPKD